MVTMKSRQGHAVRVPVYAGVRAQRNFNKAAFLMVFFLGLLLLVQLTNNLPSPSQRGSGHSLSSTTIHRPVAQASDEVAAWLRKIGLEATRQAFTKLGVESVGDFSFVEMADIEALGLPPVQKRKLWAAIQASRAYRPGLAMAANISGANISGQLAANLTLSPQAAT